MTATSFGDVHATGEDRQPSSGKSNVAGQPPITPGSGLLSTDWLPGPSDETKSPVVVSLTDFHSNCDQDWQQIAELGMKLAESWPIMRGAVGLWLWGKPAEWRGGSLSVWDSNADLRRFIRWPVHVAIMKNWRGRIRVQSASWDDDRFVPSQAWLRAEAQMLAPRDISAARHSAHD
jgi:hypothetical protein